MKEKSWTGIGLLDELLVGLGRMSRIETDHSHHSHHSHQTKQQEFDEKEDDDLSNPHHFLPPIPEDHRSHTPTSIYEGKLPKSDGQLDVYIIKHEDNDCIELFGCNPKTKTCSNHMFLDFNKLKSQLQLDDSSVPVAPNPHNVHPLIKPKSFHLSEECIHQFIINYILHRMSIVQNDHRQLLIEMKRDSFDKINFMNFQIDTLIEKPQEVHMTSLHMIEEMKSRNAKVPSNDSEESEEKEDTNEDKFIESAPNEPPPVPSHQRVSSAKIAATKPQTHPFERLDEHIHESKAIISDEKPNSAHNHHHSVHEQPAESKAHEVAHHEHEQQQQQHHPQPSPPRKDEKKKGNPLPPWRYPSAHQSNSSFG